MCQTLKKKYSLTKRRVKVLLFVVSCNGFMSEFARIPHTALRNWCTLSCRHPRRMDTVHGPPDCLGWLGADCLPPTTGLLLGRQCCAI